MRTLEEIESLGFSALRAEQFPLPEVEGEGPFLSEYEDLQPDQHMADGGDYRLRRFGRFRLHRGVLEPQSDHSIFQELKDNPLNGGVLRTFAPFTPGLWSNPFLRALILKDAQLLELDQESQSWDVGVHCVRILARPHLPGQPAPEGIHRDAERFTVQHLIARQNIQGGVFSAYDESHRPLFHWLQLRRWDTIFFTGSTWHGATPVQSRVGGHRDILLVDFQPRETPG